MKRWNYFKRVSGTYGSVSGSIALSVDDWDSDDDWYSLVSTEDCEDFDYFHEEGSDSVRTIVPLNVRRL